MPINWRIWFFFSCFGCLNVKDSIYLNLVTYRLNILSGDPVFGIRYPVSGIRYPVSGIRYPVSGIRYPVSGIRYPVSQAFYLFCKELRFVVIHFYISYLESHARTVSINDRWSLTLLFFSINK
jgi:hypothetical protein